MQMVKHCNKFPREVVNAPPLETFVVRLGRALSNLIFLKISLLIAECWTWWILKVLFNPNSYLSP